MRRRCWPRWPPRAVRPVADWVYKRTEPELFTVGFYGPNGYWETDSDHGSRDEAAARVRFLNGGELAPAPASSSFPALDPNPERNS